ncbi:MEP1-like protein [Mya arenaria]|uniref:MEP1-like protein n=1 Tax=Mya arenaria TaxID=6604 RepID=A0ABY7ESP1_MYAAR|nr:MEP1-like protein [Mya arenaria]
MSNTADTEVTDGDERHESGSESTAKIAGKMLEPQLLDSTPVEPVKMNGLAGDKAETVNGLLGTKPTSSTTDDGALALGMDSTSEDKEQNANTEPDHSVTNGSSEAHDRAPSLPAPPPLTPAPGVVAMLPVSSPNTSVSANSPMLVSTGYTLPGGATVVQQGSQYGYITKMGAQTLFVPLVPNQGSQSAVLGQLSVRAGAPAPQQPAVSKPTPAPQTAPIPPPKSSWEMMELMRWEVQNRIADNWNWSVAFHQKKDELSSVTSFLLELGSDVVKEQVYKDIIHIQTKKKHSGELKDTEVESLDKMKTVYDNTRKKVEHLQLKNIACKHCNFKTESKVVLENHSDAPHFDPPWDTNRGWMECSHCDYRTRVVAQFLFHMQDIHKRQAKFVDRDPPFQCSLCPFNSNTKNKIEKHIGKCMKHFKLQGNLQPYYHDVNYCMKSCFYKPKKPVLKPAPPPPPPAVKPATRPAMHTRQQGSIAAPPMLPTATRQLRPTVPQIAPRPQVSQQAPGLRAPAPGQQTAMRSATPRFQPRTPQQPPRPNKEMAGFEVCELCGGYVKDRQALRIHFYYAHKVELPQAIFSRPNAPLLCGVCKATFWTTQGLTKHKKTQWHFTPSTTGNTTTPASADGNSGNHSCFMCHRKVPNIFVHVEQTHGMTMKDMVLMKKCIMCGVTGTDRRALEVHMATAHGVLIKSSDYVQDKPAVQKPSSPAGPLPAKNIGKINFCVFCEIQFPDNIQLTVHCLKKHATCRTCGMVVPSSVHLENHADKCMKANKKCTICGLRNMTPDSYATHLNRHIKKCSVKIQNLTDDQIDEAVEKLKREYKPVLISLDSDDSDVEVVETKPSKMKVVIDKDDNKRPPKNNDIEELKIVDVRSEVGNSEEKTDDKKKGGAETENKTETENSSGISDKDKQKVALDVQASEREDVEKESEKVNIDQKSENVDAKQDSENVDVEKDSVAVQKVEQESENVKVEQESKNVTVEQESKNVTVEQESKNITVEQESENVEQESENVQIEKESENINVELESENVAVTQESENVDDCNSKETDNEEMKMDEDVLLGKSESEERMSEIADGKEEIDEDKLLGEEDSEHSLKRKSPEEDISVETEPKKIKLDSKGS